MAPGWPFARKLPVSSAQPLTASNDNRADKKILSEK